MNDRTFFIIDLYARMTYFLYNEHQVTLKKMFPTKMTIFTLRHCAHQIHYTSIAVFIRIIFYFMPFVCTWRCVCMLFVLTPVLLYM